MPPCSSMLPYITSFRTLNCQTRVTLSLSWYLHLSDWNHKNNHFPNVGSLFCQAFQNVTVPLHFRRMNKWEAINMSLSLHSGTLHCTSMQRTVCLRGSGSDVRFVRQQRYVNLSAWKKCVIPRIPILKREKRVQYEQKSTFHRDLSASDYEQRCGSHLN